MWILLFWLICLHIVSLKIAHRCYVNRKWTCFVTLFNFWWLSNLTCWLHHSSKKKGFFLLSKISLCEKHFWWAVMLEKLHLHFSLLMLFFCCCSSRLYLCCILYFRFWAGNVNIRRSFLYFERTIKPAKFGLQDQYVHSWLGLQKWFMRNEMLLLKLQQNVN